MTPAIPPPAPERTDASLADLPTTILGCRGEWLPGLMHAEARFVAERDPSAAYSITAHRWPEGCEETRFSVAIDLHASGGSICGWGATVADAVLSLQERLAEIERVAPVLRAVSRGDAA